MGQPFIRDVIYFVSCVLEVLDGTAFWTAGLLYGAPKLVS